MIIEKPFKHLEDEHLIRFILENLNPAYKKTSRQMARRESFKLYEARRSDLQAYFSTVDHCLSFTSDMWISPIRRNYYCVTAYWIDDD